MFDSRQRHVMSDPFQDQIFIFCIWNYQRRNTRILIWSFEQVLYMQAQAIAPTYIVSILTWPDCFSHVCLAHSLTFAGSCKSFIWSLCLDTFLSRIILPFRWLCTLKLARSAVYRFLLRPITRLCHYRAVWVPVWVIALRVNRGEIRLFRNIACIIFVGLRGFYSKVKDLWGIFALLSVFRVKLRGERNLDCVTTARCELKVLKIDLILDRLPVRDSWFLIEQVSPLRALVHRLLMLLCWISIVRIDPLLLRCLLNLGSKKSGGSVLSSTLSSEFWLDVYLYWGNLRRQVLA